MNAIRKRPALAGPGAEINTGHAKGSTADGYGMRLIYDGRSTRKLTKRLLMTLLFEHGVSEDEFRVWLDISVDDFAALNPRLRYETFKAQFLDYLQTGRLQPNEIKGAMQVIHAREDFARRAIQRQRSASFDGWRRDAA